MRPYTELQRERIEHCGEEDKDGFAEFCGDCPKCLKAAQAEAERPEPEPDDE